MNETDAAEKAEREHRWSDAVEAWSAIVGRRPTWVHLVRYSMALQQAGDLEAAERIARRAIDLAPTESRPHLQRGVVLHLLGRFHDAVTQLEKGLAIDEVQPFLNRLGVLKAKIGDREGARRVLERSLELMPEDDEAHFALGRVLLPIEPASAATHFSATLRIDPKFPDATRELGEALLWSDQLDAAGPVVASAAERQPRDAWAQFLLGYWFERTDQKANALRQYVLVTTLEPKNGFYLGTLAELHSKLGNRVEAETLFRSALEHDISDGVALERSVAIEERQPLLTILGDSLRRAGERAKAEAVLRRSIELAPDDEEALFNLGLVLQHSHPNEAVECFQKV